LFEEGERRGEGRDDVKGEVGSFKEGEGFCGGFEAREENGVGVDIVTWLVEFEVGKRLWWGVC